VPSVDQKRVFIDTVRDEDLLGEIDPLLWRECSIDRRVLITANCADFLALAATVREHPGLLLVRMNGRPTRQTQIECIKAALEEIGFDASTWKNRIFEVLIPPAL
jgi:predicted nuclease of predicted toxin-antitoxin system